MNTRFILCALVFAAAAAAVARGANADPPEGVVRTFGYLVHVDTEDHLNHLPDFLSEDSKVVTVLPIQASEQGVGGTFEFIDTTIPDFDFLWLISNGESYEQPDYLDGALFYEGPPAHHAVKGGSTSTEDGLWFWRIQTPSSTQAPPEPGAHTHTGPDRQVISQEVFRIRQCVSGSCGAEWDGKWRVIQEGSVEDTQSIGGDYLVVVRATFSK